MAVTTQPIQKADTDRVGAYLHQNLNHRISAQEWARAMVVPWSVEAPNCGFMLLDDDRIVGVYLAFYSRRTIEGREERFCNLAAWCVDAGYRAHSLRLLKAMMGQKGYHFTDLSPSGNTVPVNVRMKFSFLDTTAAMMLNLPWPSWLSPGSISAEPEVLERSLVGRDLEIYRDHAGAKAAHHVLLRRGQRSCYVMFRRDRRKRLPVFVSLLHVSNPDLFHEMAGQFGAHVLVRHGALATLAEFRVVKRRPRRSFVLSKNRPKMFKSADLAPDQIDYLYSELVCVAW